MGYITTKKAQEDFTQIWAYLDNQKEPIDMKDFINWALELGTYTTICRCWGAVKYAIYQHDENLPSEDVKEDDSLL